MKLKSLVMMSLLAAASVSFASKSEPLSWWVGGTGKVSLAHNPKHSKRIKVTLNSYSGKEGVWLKNCEEGTMKLMPEANNTAICTVPKHAVDGAQITNVNHKPNEEQSWGNYKILS